MSLIDESDALHERVRTFVRAETGSRLGGRSGQALGAGAEESFESLALDIARFQARHSRGFRRLVDARSGSLDSVESIPPVPAEAFRAARVAVHPPELDGVCFETSGTTGSSTGRHPMRRTDTYREVALRFGERALLDEPGPRVVVALAAWSPVSSLAFMMRAFLETWDGRPLADETGFDAGAPSRWLASVDGVDLEGMRRATALARERGEPLIVSATAFALAFLLDALGDEILEAPAGTVVMQTGGFKGRTRTMDSEELRSAVARAFRIDRERVVGEYGMTELTSQLYEGVLPGARLEGPLGVYLPPPWLRVDPVDPESLSPVDGDAIGLARFVDLGNVDSAVSVVTRDRIRRRGGGVELLGRSTGAPPRGCSLAVEQMVLGGR